MNWLPIQEQYRNSVLQIITIKGDVNPFRPYSTPVDKKNKGTGFIVDIDNGIVVTNSHVSQDAISIQCRAPSLGKRDLPLDLISFSPQRDLALLRLRPSDIQLLIEGLTDPTSLNIPIGDHMKLRQTEEIMALGFAMGREELSITTGVVSALHVTPDDESSEMNNDKVTRPEEDPSYIQITAPINPGNSGGPLLDREGKLVGVNAAGIIFSQNVSFAIGSRTLLSIYREMVKQSDKRRALGSPDDKQGGSLFTIPKVSFDWCRVNEDLLTLSGTTKKGIYVTQVYPDSIFDTLKRGDIITAITYEDPFWLKESPVFDVTAPGPFKGALVTATFDSYGDLLLDAPCEIQPCRRMSVKELFDNIMVNSDIELSIVRDKQEYRLKTKYVPIKTSITQLVFPLIEPYDYEIICGMCLCRLALNHVAVRDDLTKYVDGRKRYKPYILVVQVFPETSASQTNSIKEGDILRSINSTKVRTMEDLREVMTTIGDTIVIETKDRAVFALQVDKMIEEDLRVLERFNIKHEYLFSQ